MELSVGARTSPITGTTIDQAPAKTAAATNTSATSAPVLTEAQQRQIQQARDVVKLKSELAAQRKALARKGLEDIKKSMDELRLIATVSPKATAHALKNMSKRLAAASETYASAGSPAELEALSRQVEDKARALEGKPPETRTYTDPESAADGQFLADIKGLKKQMDGMFNAAASQLAHQHFEEAEELVRDYNDSFKPVAQAAQTLVGWHRPEHIAQVLGHAVNFRA